MEKSLDSKRIYSGRAVNLRVDTVQKTSGAVTTREVVEHGDCIAVVVLDERDDVVMVRQYRWPVRKILLEIPAGGIEVGEKPEECVKRELQEEIGYLPRKINKIGGFYVAPGYCTEFMHLFLASDLKKSRLVAEDTDEIEVVRIHPVDIPHLIECGEICDAKSIVGLLAVLRKAI